MVEQIRVRTWWYYHQPGIHTPVHVLPNHDCGEHTIEDDCKCGSHINEDGNVVHHSFDGREEFELGFRKLS